jgi:hypothetical protein
MALATLTHPKENCSAALVSTVSAERSMLDSARQDSQSAQSEESDLNGVVDEAATVAVQAIFTHILAV